MDMEKLILEKTGWTEKQKDYLGTLVYNIENSKQESICDIIINRQLSDISIDFFTPDKDGDLTRLTYNIEKNSIVRNKTDSEIRGNEDVLVFLDIISNFIVDQKGVFFPKSKKENIGSKLNIK